MNLYETRLRDDFSVELYVRKKISCSSVFCNTPNKIVDVMNESFSLDTASEEMFFFLQ